MERQLSCHSSIDSRQDSAEQAEIEGQLKVVHVLDPGFIHDNHMNTVEQAGQKCQKDSCAASRARRKIFQKQQGAGGSAEQSQHLFYRDPFLKNQDAAHSHQHRIHEMERSRHSHRYV